MQEALSKAGKARQLVASRGFAVLTTLSVKVPGFPFGSITNYAADERGRPLLLMSSLAVHTKNVSADPHASLVVYAESAEEDPLASARLNLMGELRPVSDEELEQVRQLYLTKHPQAEDYLSFGDFAFYRLEVTNIYIVAGFGEMGWISVADYERV